MILTLGLGIGANAAMFDVVDRLMFRPLTHLHDPDTVHRVYWQWQARGTTVTSMSTQYPRYVDLGRWTNSFSQLAAFSERNLPVGEGETLRERRVGAVSASFFDFFDASPALGRFFEPEEDLTPRGTDVAVLSHGFWQSEYGGRNVLGEHLKVGNIPATVIGVAPRGFAGVNDADPPAVYVPITTYAGSTGTSDAETYYTRYQWGWVHVLARRAPGVTLEEAEADASQAFRRSWLAGQDDNPSAPSLESAEPRVAVSSVRPAAGPDPTLEARTALWVSIVAAIVLLIACANVANLFLMRALRRHRETAVQLALGVGRWRLMVRPLVDGVVLALAGGGAALLVAGWVGYVMGRSLIAISSGSPGVLDGRTVAFTLGLAAASGLIVGLVPALRSGQGDLSSSLRAGMRGNADGARLRASLLVVQTALSVVLLIGAVLFVRSLEAVRAMPLGYDPDPVLLVNRVIGGDAFEDSIQIPLRRSLLEEARSLPAVESAAWVHTAPFVNTSWTDLYIDGVDSVEEVPGIFTYQATTSDYFRTVGTRILHGRSLEEYDLSGTPHVAVVSESMARVLWPDRDPVGRCFRIRSASAPCMTVVGVAEDIVQRTITQTERYHYYLPIEQHSASWWGNGMVLKVRGDPAQEAEGVRQALQRVMPGTSYVTVQPLGDVVQRQQQSWRMGATMFVAFGVLALIVAGVGLYGAIGYDVAQRSHELGVRVALGAQPGRITQIVVRQSFYLTLLGTAFGVLVAALASPMVEPILFRQSARDPGVYVAVGTIMLVVALAASALPAFRASRADPIRALRAD